MTPNGPAIWRAERIETALWAVLAKEPDCRRGVLPDVGTGQSVPSTRDGTLASSPERSEGSRCKEGMARVFAVMVQILLSITSVGPAPLLQIKSGVQV